MVLEVDDWVETKMGNIALVVSRKSRRVVTLYNPVDNELHEDVDIDHIRGCFPAVRKLLKRTPS